MNKLLLIAALGLAAWKIYKRNQPELGTISQAEAARVLDIPLNADKARIIAAHKRLIIKVHPDTGGSAELASRVNEARDVMLENGA